MKSNIIKDFSLPTYVKGKSFAEASKAIDGKFKDRLDSHSQATKKELLSRLANAQEHIKMQEQLAQGVASPNVDQNQMFNGGRPAVQGVNSLQPNGVQMQAPIAGVQAPLATQAIVPDKPANTDTGIEGAGMAGGVVGAAGTALELGQLAFGPSGVDVSGASGRGQVASTGMTAATGALKGASAGAAFGPWGAAIGGVVGGAAGIIGGSKANKDQLNANKNAGLIENNQFSNDFAGGGFTDDTEPPKKFDINAPLFFDKSGNTNKIDPSNPLYNSFLNGPNTQAVAKKAVSKAEPQRPVDTSVNSLQMNGKPTFNPIDGVVLPDTSKLTAGPLPSQKYKGDGLGLSGTPEWAKDNYGEILNAAPIGINALQLAMLKKDNPVSYDRLDSRYKEHRVDERSLENRVQNEANNTTRALANATNGSAGALRTNLIGSQLAKTNALSDAYLKADQMNAQEKRYGQQFNGQVDAINQRTSTMETESRRADKGAFEQTKAAMIDRLGTNIGDFGKNQMYKKMAIQATDYGWDGKYYVNPKTGHSMSAAEYKAKFGNVENKENDSK